MYGTVEIAYSKTNASPHIRANHQTDTMKQSPCLSCKHYIPNKTIAPKCRESHPDCPLGSVHQDIACATNTGNTMETDPSVSKHCIVCGVEINKPYKLSWPDWERKKFCSQSCAATNRQRVLAAKNKIRDKKIRQAHRDGVTNKQLAKENGISEGRIRHILARR